MSPIPLQALIVLAIYAALIVYAIRVLGLFVRHVNAHERIARALEIVAQKLNDDGKR